MRSLFVLPLVLALLAGQAIAQEQEREREREQKQEAETADRSEVQAARERSTERLRRAVRLPRTAEEAREAGVSEAEVREVLERGRESGVPADEMQEVLAEETAAVKEHGAIDNFGAFVQSQLEQEKRGRELSEAIHQEHARHGKGKYKDEQHASEGKGKAKGKGKGKGKGRDRTDEVAETVEEVSQEPEDRAGAAREKAKKRKKEKN